MFVRTSSTGTETVTFFKIQAIRLTCSEYQQQILQYMINHINELLIDTRIFKTFILLLMGIRATIQL